MFDVSIYRTQLRKLINEKHGTTDFTEKKSRKSVKPVVAYGKEIIMINVGDKFKNFTLLNQNSEKVSLKDYILNPASA